MSRARLSVVVRHASLVGLAGLAFGGCGSSTSPTDARVVLDGARDTLAPDAAADDATDALAPTDGSL